MIRKFALFAVCIAVGTSALAQADQSNPFMEMARKFKEGHDFWQDEKFQHSYDAYVDCYKKSVSDAQGSRKGSPTDAVYHGAFMSCEAQRLAGTTIATTRIADFHPAMSVKERAETADTYRRSLAAVLNLGEF